jgi:hypothetical protein
MQSSKWIYETILSPSDDFGSFLHSSLLSINSSQGCCFSERRLHHLAISRSMEERLTVLTSPTEIGRTLTRNVCVNIYKHQLGNRKDRLECRASP